MKLRQRNIGPLLEANGWAINSRAKLNISFGKSLTKMAVLPPGSEVSLGDAFPEKKSSWKFYVGVAIFLLIAFYVLRMPVVLQALEPLLGGIADTLSGK